MGGVNLNITYVIKHKKVKYNVIAHALSRQYTMLSQWGHKFFGLETIKDLSATDLDIKEAFHIVKIVAHGTNMPSLIVSSFVLTSFVFQLVLFAYCFCRRRMEVV
jgi:methionine synthase I (cobalamin-dependent)